MSASGDEQLEVFGTSARDRLPLIEFMIDALRQQRCRVLFQSPPTEAPFRITFETPEGERIGIVAYAFLANTKETRNRPDDEHRFQIKYGTKDGRLHELWQDPAGLYVTLLLGINPELGFFVGADPVLHSPTKFFISLEFKQRHVAQVLKTGWHAWERERRNVNVQEPVEVLVGGTARSFLRYIRFEREALREDQGHRQLLAEAPTGGVVSSGLPVIVPGAPSEARLHQLAHEFALKEAEVLDLIAGARRLKMAVRGWVAEEHLVRTLSRVRGVTDCARIDEEGGPDVRLRFEGSRPISVECKNVLRQRSAEGLARIDFQRTRASKNDPCSRYYSPADFDVVAACMHAVTTEWAFRYVPAEDLGKHKTCVGKLANNVRVGAAWQGDPREVLRRVARR